MSKVEDKLLSLLGICRKAGKLVHGFDAVAESVKKHEACLVLTAKDLSPKSAKEIGFISNKANVEVISAPVTISEIEGKTGKRAGILAVTDKGLREAVKSEISRAKEEDLTV